LSFVGIDQPPSRRVPQTNEVTVNYIRKCATVEFFMHLKIIFHFNEIRIYSDNSKFHRQ